MPTVSLILAHVSLGALLGPFPIIAVAALIYGLWTRGSDNARAIRRANICAWASLIVCAAVVLLPVMAAVLWGIPTDTDIYAAFAFVLLPSLIAALVAVRITRKPPPDSREPHCDECGYLLTGLTQPRCPECGHPFPPSWLKPQQHTSQEPL